MSQNTILTILGKKGSGKTTLCKEMLTESNRVIIIDANGEYEAPTVCWGLEDSKSALLKLENKPRFRMSLRVYRNEEALELIGLCFYIRNTTVVIDEASLYCSPVSIPDEISRLIRFGRHKQISLYVIARRAVELPRDITANSDILVTFKQHEPRDIAYLCSIYSSANRVSTLREYQCIAFGDGSKAPLALRRRLIGQHLEEETPQEKDLDTGGNM